MTDYGQRLRQLNDRRRGLYNKKGEYLYQDAATAPTLIEKYASLREPDAIRYAVGIMQPVDPGYTATCFSEGERVVKQCKERIALQLDHRFQGSVPLDVHVRANSDVDVLVLRLDYQSIDNGMLERFGWTDARIDMVEALRTLRHAAAAALRAGFPAAAVDTSGAKCISISGGSLKRIVDVVPSNWHDTYAYQASRLQEDREVRILDNRKGITLTNRPFKHIAEVERKCNAHGGNVRRIIRALKNLRYHATPKLEEPSSFDIASIVWNMDSSALNVGYSHPLKLLEAAQQHLLRVLINNDYRESLRVPDGSRRIFDDAGKYAGTARLYDELKSLLDDVAKTASPYGVLTEQAKTAALQKSIYL
jgi:hypothetical protein